MKRRIIQSYIVAGLGTRGPLEALQTTKLSINY